MAINLSDNILAKTTAPADAKWGPYISDSLSGAIGLALGYLLPSYRYEGLTVGLKVGSNDIVEYWFKSGIEDTDLILKTQPVEYYDGRFVNITGDTMTGGLVISSNGNIFQANDSNNKSILKIDSSGYFLLNSASITGVNSNTVIFSINKLISNAAFIDYVINNPLTNAYRSGTIMSVWDSENNKIEYNETCTNDLSDNTSGINFIMDINISPGYVRLKTNIFEGSWNIKIGFRII